MIAPQDTYRVSGGEGKGYKSFPRTLSHTHPHPQASSYSFRKLGNKWGGIKEDIGHQKLGDGEKSLVADCSQEGGTFSAPLFWSRFGARVFTTCAMTWSACCSVHTGEMDPGFVVRVLARVPRENHLLLWEINTGHGIWGIRLKGFHASWRVLFLPLCFPVPLVSQGGALCVAGSQGNKSWTSKLWAERYCREPCLLGRRPEGKSTEKTVLCHPPTPPTSISTKTGRGDGGGNTFGLAFTHRNLNEMSARF